MLRITIEILPLGRESQARVLHQAIIYNDGSGSLTKGNYQAVLLTKGQTLIEPAVGQSWATAQKKIWRHGCAYDFPRQRLSAWQLLYRVLQGVISDKGTA